MLYSHLLHADKHYPQLPVIILELNVGLSSAIFHLSLMWWKTLGSVPKAVLSSHTH